MPNARTTLKPWQHGYELDLLAALAEPFRLVHKPLVFGAFGLVKERDVAEALAAGSLLYTCEGPGSADGRRCVGAAIIRRLKSGSAQSDFAARPVKLAAGAVSIPAFAATTDEAARKLIGAATARGAESTLWVEIFEEDGTAKAAVLAAGLRYQASKVMAGSEIKGLYSTAPGQAIPNDDAEDATLAILDEHYLSPGILSDIRRELAAFGDWTQHYSSYNKAKSWTAFALRGYDPDDPGFIIKPAEMSAKWKDENAPRMHAEVGDTAAFDSFPVTRQIVAAIPGAKDRVRFMKLAPGQGELTRHADITDREAGLRDGLVARLHIPITTNPAVRFSAWDKRGQALASNFPEGCLAYLDQRKPHAVVNAGAVERIHLVIDVRSGAELRRRIGEARHASRPALVA